MLPVHRVQRRFHDAGMRHRRKHRREGARNAGREGLAHRRPAERRMGRHGLRGRRGTYLPDRTA